MHHHLHLLPVHEVHKVYHQLLQTTKQLMLYLQHQSSQPHKHKCPRLKANLPPLQDHLLRHLLQ